MEKQQNLNQKEQEKQNNDDIRKQVEQMLEY